MTKQLFTSILAAVALTLGAAAHAQDAGKGKAAAESLKCLKCHAADKDGAGPSYKKVATKFNKDAGKIIAAFDKVEDHAKVKKTAKPEDLKNIAAWIISL